MQWKALLVTSIGGPRGGGCTSLKIPLVISEARNSETKSAYRLLFVQEDNRRDKKRYSAHEWRDGKQERQNKEKSATKSNSETGQVLISNYTESTVDAGLALEKLVCLPCGPWSDTAVTHE